jgi:hypothetical protein
VCGTDHRRNANFVQVSRGPGGHVRGREDSDRGLATDLLQLRTNTNGLCAFGQVTIELGVDEDEPEGFDTGKPQSAGATGGDHDFVASMAQPASSQSRLSRIGCYE